MVPYFSEDPLVIKRTKSLLDRSGIQPITCFKRVTVEGAQSLTVYIHLKNQKLQGGTPTSYIGLQLQLPIYKAIYRGPITPFITTSRGPPCRYFLAGKIPNIYADGFG